WLMAAGQFSCASRLTSASTRGLPPGLPDLPDLNAIALSLAENMPEFSCIMQLFSSGGYPVGRLTAVAVGVAQLQGHGCDHLRRVCRLPVESLLPGQASRGAAVLSLSGARREQHRQV